MKVTSASQTKTILWQWVSYVLWQLSGLALIVLITSTLGYLFINKTVGDYVYLYYVLGVIIFLAPAALLVDRQYAQLEPAKQEGFAGVVMIVNAILVFITVLAAAVVSFVAAMLLIVGDPHSHIPVTLLLTGLVTLIVGVPLFLRILNPGRKNLFKKLYAPSITGVTTIAIIFALCVPVRMVYVTRYDRMIENNLDSISSTVTGYTYGKHALPASLHDLKLPEDAYGDASKLVTKGLVIYKKDAKAPKVKTDVDKDYSRNTQRITTTTSLAYQLCVDYAHTKGDGTKPDNTYDAQLHHPAGIVCYDLTASYDAERTAVIY